MLVRRRLCRRWARSYAYPGSIPMSPLQGLTITNLGDVPQEANRKPHPQCQPRQGGETQISHKEPTGSIRIPRFFMDPPAPDAYDQDHARRAMGDGPGILRRCQLLTSHRDGIELPVPPISS